MKKHCCSLRIMSLLLCLQETHLKDTDNISIKNYTAFHTFSANNERAAGGVSIFNNNNAPYSHIPLNTNLQAVTISITLHRVITLCSIYIPPSLRLSPKDLGDLVPQLPGGGRVVRWCWVNFQCRGVLQFGLQ